MNIGERYKRVTFITYPHENKHLVNVVNIARKFFTFRVANREFALAPGRDMNVMNIMNMWKSATFMP